eukprot:CAMPEP_0198145860 /NCGR_PEP_ID=MMETSP1443-20131203/25831_1 /TAXON_ID=186043 /ORGANISM="Entomoneis sp., Strain CCMP2396" /LENGTH=513 /DNA_ID=CAMNT_0043809613 /DNA_START=495 /DNA_END=2036 /DNA_ORIENTATION=-
MIEMRKPFFLFLCLLSTAFATKSPFLIIIDGGSTGSRLHIFEFVTKATGVECLRRGSARANGPLSGFARLPDEIHQPVDKEAVADHLISAFTHAAKTIPAAYHSNTRVWYAATAGMRLLIDSEQQAIYDAVYQGLLDRPEFVFRAIQRDDIGTLSGELEGFYGAVAANYLKGTINADLELDRMNSSSNRDVHSGPIGALDMGGASTQIVFLPRKDASSDEQTCVNEAAACSREPRQQRMQGSDFFSTSYLSYGADQFRERLWDTWIEERMLENAEGDACTSDILENPCSFQGYSQEYRDYILIGTGDTEKCVGEVQRLIPHPTEELLENLGTHVGGVEHPPVGGKFFAMSLYFFTLDSLRELSTNNKEAYEALNLSWPSPSIQELHNALDGLCGRSWEGDLEDIQHNAHAFTRAEVLPHRCIESVYMVTLLKDGFGFSPESRDITFTFLVDGSEVEWSLGMALSLRLEQQQAAEENSSENETEQGLAKKNFTRRQQLFEDKVEDCVESQAEFH